jgi:hypothetical protein
VVSEFNMKKLFLLLLILQFNNSLYAQFEEKPEYKIGLTTGYTNSKTKFLQLGAIIGTDYGNMHIPSNGFGIGTDIGKINNSLVVGAKVFYEYNVFIVSGLRLSAINYVTEKLYDFRVMPQVGFSFFGFLNFMYGYSIPTLGNELNEISRNSFSITLNLIP